MPKEGPYGCGHGTPRGVGDLFGREGMRSGIQGLVSESQNPILFLCSPLCGLTFRETAEESETNLGKHTRQETVEGSPSQSRTLPSIQQILRSSHRWWEPAVERFGTHKAVWAATTHGGVHIERQLPSQKNLQGLMSYKLDHVTDESLIEH